MSFNAEHTSAVLQEWKTLHALPPRCGCQIGILQNWCDGFVGGMQDTISNCNHIQMLTKSLGQWYKLNDGTEFYLLWKMNQSNITRMMKCFVGIKKEFKRNKF